ncbi:hypothetical protein L7F22_013859 [Adiantum nelumboides]|nr:hypothetical protein [Adiantum nelumboides]
MHTTKTKSWADLSETSRGDRPLLQKIWDKWAAASVGTVLTGAALLNYLPDRPSRMFSLLVAQEGLTLQPPDLRLLVDGVKSKTLQNDYFWLCDGKYIVTTISEQYFCARRANSTAHEGEGAIIACITGFILLTTYEGSLGAAAKAMAVTGLLTEYLGQRN